MIETILVSPDNKQRASILIARTNTVIDKLNNLANEYAEYENQKSIYVVNNHKFQRSLMITNELLGDIEKLFDEENTLHSILRSLPKLRIIKRQNIRNRLEEVVQSIKQKEAYIQELKKEQQNLIAIITCSKHKMNKLSYSKHAYTRFALKEYNYLAEKLNSITNLELETISCDEITTLNPITFSDIKTIDKETENEIIY